jgi:hypothetical protein
MHNLSGPDDPEFTQTHISSGLLAITIVAISSMVVGAVMMAVYFKYFWG